MQFDTMAKCTGNTTSLHEPIFQESLKENYVDEMCSNSPNNKMNDIVMLTSDDEYAESVVTIGEIDVDEYFDDIFCDNNLSAPVVHDTSSNSQPLTCKPSTNNATNDTPNEPMNPLQLAVDSVHPTIVVEQNRNISFEQRKRNEVIKTAAIINQYLRSGKRVRLTQGENGSKRFIYSGLTLDHIGVTALPRFLWINNLDEHIMSTNRLLLRLPACYSVSNVLKSFAVKKKINPKTLEIMLEAFNTILPLWCLREIEKLQYENLKEKYPDKKLCEIYGVVHYVRFTTYLPYLLRVMGPYARQFNDSMVDFTNNFINFLEESKITIDQDDFYHVMPDYHRMTFKSGPCKYKHIIKKYNDGDDHRRHNNDNDDDDDEEDL